MDGRIHILREGLKKSFCADIGRSKARVDVVIGIVDDRPEDLAWARHRCRPSGLAGGNGPLRLLPMCAQVFENAFAFLEHVRTPDEVPAGV